MGETTTERDLYPESWAAINTPGNPYRPCNGTEGVMFMERWCDDCANDSRESFCPILGDAMTYSKDDPEYPKEWVFDPRGQPSCTAFRERGVEPPVKPAPGQLSLFGAPAGSETARG